MIATDMNSEFVNKNKFSDKAGRIQFYLRKMVPQN